MLCTFTWYTITHFLLLFHRTWTKFSQSIQLFRSSHPDVFCKKYVLRNFTKFTGKYRKPETCNFIKKETLAQVFSCEFCKISKNTFYYKTPLVAASELLDLSIEILTFITRTGEHILLELMDLVNLKRS